MYIIGLFSLIIYFIYSTFFFIILLKKLRISFKFPTIISISPLILCFTSYGVFLLTHNFKFSCLSVGIVSLITIIVNRELLKPSLEMMSIFFRNNCLNILLSIIFSLYFIYPFLINKNLVFYSGYGTDAMGYVRVAESISNSSYRIKDFPPALSQQKINPEMGWINYVSQVEERPFIYYVISYFKYFTFTTIFNAYYLLSFLILFSSMLYILQKLKKSRTIIFLTFTFLTFFWPLYGVLQNQYYGRFFSVFLIFIIINSIIEEIANDKNFYNKSIFLFIAIFFSQQVYDLSVTIFFLPVIFIYLLFKIRKGNNIYNLIKKVSYLALGVTISLMINNNLIYGINAILQGLKAPLVNLPLINDYKFYKHILPIFIFTSIIGSIIILFKIRARKANFFHFATLYLLSYLVFQFIKSNINTQPTYYLSAYYLFGLGIVIATAEKNKLVTLLLILLLITGFYKDRIDYITLQIKNSELGQVTKVEYDLKKEIIKQSLPICINKTAPIRMFSLLYVFRDINQFKISQYKEMFEHTWRFFYTKKHAIDSEKAIRDYNSYLKDMKNNNIKCLVVNDTRYNSQITNKEYKQFGQYQLYIDHVVNLYDDFKPLQ